MLRLKVVKKGSTSRDGPGCTAARRHISWARYGFHLSSSTSRHAKQRSATSSQREEVGRKKSYRKDGTRNTPRTATLRAAQYSLWLRQCQSFDSSPSPNVSRSMDGGPGGTSAIVPLEQLFPVACDGGGSRHCPSSSFLLLSRILLVLAPFALPSVLLTLASTCLFSLLIHPFLS